MQGVAQAVFSGGLFAVGVWSMVDAYQRGVIVDWNPVVTGGIFAILIGFYLCQGLQQAFDRRPVLVIGPEGLYLRSSLPTPIPWRRIAKADCVTGMFRPGRLDIEVDAETYSTMRLGMRLLGDDIVRRNPLRHSFSILARSYDHSATEIFAALKQYWPPRGIPS
jgi:hypothetical protein